MLKNFFMLAGRNMRRHGTYSLLNILGLSLGIACILMLSLHIKEELSYDKAFPKHDRIYRVCTTDWAKSSPIVGREMSSYFPQIGSYARFAEMGDNVLSTTQGKKAIFTGFFADSSAVGVFSLQTVSGNPVDALSTIGSVVLTRSAATRLFGNTDPIGQKLTDNDRDNFFVKGVIEDLPSNSHLHFDFLTSMATLDKYVGPGSMSNKNWMFGWTYILLRHPGDIRTVRSRLVDFWTAYRSDFNDKKKARQEAATARLMPVTDIHLHSNGIQEMGPNGSILYIYIFMAVAFLIGIIACINFINLFTTQALKRSKEVAVHKVLGAPRSRVIF